MPLGTAQNITALSGFMAVVHIYIYRIQRKLHIEQIHTGEEYDLCPANSVAAVPVHDSEDDGRRTRVSEARKQRRI